MMPEYLIYVVTIHDGPRASRTHDPVGVVHAFDRATATLQSRQQFGLRANQTAWPVAASGLIRRIDAEIDRARSSGRVVTFAQALALIRSCRRRHVRLTSAVRAAFYNPAPSPAGVGLL